MIQSDASMEARGSTRSDAAMGSGGFSPDSSVRLDGSTRADSTAQFDPPTQPDAADGGAPIDDASTPCRNFATLAFGVQFTSGTDRLLATSKLGATLISAQNWSVQRTYAGHRGQILAAATSSDGSRGASVGNDDELRMWETATGRTVAAQPSTAPAAVAFAGGGNTVVLLDGTGIHAFGWGSASQLWSIPSEGGVAPPVLASTPAGTVLLAGATGGGLDLLNAANGSIVIHFDAEVGAFSPDGSKLVTAADASLGIVDVSSPTQAPVMLTAPFSASAVALGPNANWVAVAGRAGLDYQIEVLSVPGGETLRTFDTSYVARTLSASLDGRYLAAGANELYVFDVTDGTVAYSNRQRGMIWRQSLSSRDPYLAFARVGGDPEIWDYATGQRLQLIPQPSSGNLGTVAFAPSGDLLINFNDTASYWPPGGVAPLASFTYESGTQRPDDRGPLVFSPDGATLAGPGAWTAPGNLRLWNATTGALLRETPAHPDDITAMAWSPNGQLIVTAGPRTVAGDGGSDTAAPDGSSLSSQTVKLWNVSDATLVRTLDGHDDIVRSLAFSPDGSLLATADREGRVRLWSTASGAMVRELSSPPTITGLTLDSFNGSVAFSPDGQWLASRAVHWIETGHSVYIAVYRVADGSIVRELRGFGDGNLGSIGWSTDGRYIIGGAADDLRLWCVTEDSPTTPVDAGSD